MTMADQLGEISIFSELSKKDLKSLSSLMTEVTVPVGRVLTKQGEPGREFLVITEGTANVDIDGTIVAHLAAGDIIGELAVISGTPRTATVTATSEVSLQVLTRREFMAMLDRSPSAGTKILVGAVKRLQENQLTKTN